MKNKNTYIYGGLAIAFVIACVYWVIKGNPFAPKDTVPGMANDNSSLITVNPSSLGMTDYLARIKAKEAGGGWFKKTLF